MIKYLVGRVAVGVDLPSSYTMHDVFHLNLIEVYPGTETCFLPQSSEQGSQDISVGG